MPRLSSHNDNAPAEAHATGDPQPATPDDAH